MKRTCRLTALIMALLMLVNISASATTTGITLDELDMATYMSLVQNASETEESTETDDSAESMPGPVLSDPCSEENEYCALLNELVAKPTAQARYEYMMSLYSEDADNVTLEAVMMHYFYYKTEHQAEGLICECSFPSFAPEYEPGALNVHEESCPWTFANLSVAEQYSMLCTMGADDQAPYIATLSLEQADALETYTLQQEEGKISYPCDQKPEYCLFSEYSAMNALDRFEYFNRMYAEDGDGEMSVRYGAVMIHYAEYHLDSNLICTCGKHPLPLPQYAVGDVNVHEETCPWYFTNLTTGEQYTLLNKAATEEEKAAYMATMGEDAKEKLARVNATEYTATGEKATVQISAPTGSFAGDYILSAASTALNDAQQAAMDAVALLHTIASFDISFAQLMDETAKLQPTAPVQLTFTIDTAKVFGTHIQVYHMAESTDANGEITYTAEAVGEPVAVDASAAQQTITVQASSFSLYAIADSCDGDSCKAVITADAAAATIPQTYMDAGNHTFNELKSKTSYADMRTYINELYDPTGTSTTVDTTDTSITAFMAHLGTYHSTLAADDWVINNVCSCSIYPLPAVGDSTHAEDCPWAASTNETLKAEIREKFKDDPTIDTWLATATDAMLELAVQASGLESVLTVDGYLYYVRTGDKLATYDATTGIITDIKTNLTFTMDELQAQGSTGAEETQN